MENPEADKKYKIELRQARWRAFLLGSFLVIALASIVYALVQQTEARRQEAEANQYREEGLKLRIQVMQNQAMAERQRQAAREQAQLAMAEQIKYDVVNNQLQLALKQLAKCKK